MKNDSRSKQAGAVSAGGSRSLLWVASPVIVLILVVMVVRRPWRASDPAGTPAEGLASTEGNGSRGVGSAGGRDVSRLMRSRSGSGTADSPAAIVADKSAAFARSRRRIVEEMAQRFQVEISPEVGRFFDAAEAGRWDEIKSLFNTLSSERESGRVGRDLDVLWPAIKESYGVASMAAAWPPQELLDYGESILASLRPGMVYIAGSDSARYIPALMGETGGGDRPLILPQSGLGEGNQIDYLGYLHGDRLSTLSRDDVQATFTAYMEDAQRRAAATDGSAGETLPPGEAGLFTPGRSFTTGPNPVGGLNEKLLAKLMEKNPGMSFALEQAVPMDAFYADAVPLGPILELRGGGVSEATVAAKAGESLEYWRAMAERLKTDLSMAPDAPSRAAHAQMATTQAGYFVAHNLQGEAEQAYRLAREIAPTSIEVLGQYSMFLVNSGRKPEALQLLDEYGQQNADQAYVVDQLRKTVAPPPPGEADAPAP